MKFIILHDYDKNCGKPIAVDMYQISTMEEGPLINKYADWYCKIKGAKEFATKITMKDDKIVVVVESIGYIVEKINKNN